MICDKCKKNEHNNCERGYCWCSARNHNKIKAEMDLAWEMRNKELEDKLHENCSVTTIRNDS